LTGGFSNGTVWFNSALKKHIGDGAFEKKIPTFSLNASREHLMGILDGLISSDGCVTINSTDKKQSPQLIVTFFTSSVKMLACVQTLLNRLGVNFGLSTYNSKVSGQQAFRFNISTESLKALVENDGFFISHKQKHEKMMGLITKIKPTGKKNNFYTKLNNYDKPINFVKIKKVIPIKNPTDVYDITVEGAGTFVTTAGTIAKQSDGDQLNAHVPLSFEAKEEAKNKLLPSKNLRNIKTFDPIFVPMNEAALGLFQASSMKSKKPAKKFKSDFDAIKAFNAGELNFDDEVEI